VSPINDAGALLSTTPTTIYDTWSLYGRILVSDPFGTPVSQGTVTMTVNGVPQCDFYREAGSSLCSAPLPWDSFNLRLSQGTYTVEVSYSGYGDLRPSTAAFTVNDVPTPTVTSVVTTTIDPCWIFCSESEWQATVSDAAFQDGADFWQLDTPYLSGQNDNIEFECDGKPVLLTGLSPGPDDTEVSSWVPANNYCPDNQASFVYQGDASYALSSG
jgi:hypothetical protein